MLGCNLGDAEPIIKLQYGSILGTGGITACYCSLSSTARVEDWGAGRLGDHLSKRSLDRKWLASFSCLFSVGAVPNLIKDDRIHLLKFLSSWNIWLVVSLSHFKLLMHCIIFLPPQLTLRFFRRNKKPELVLHSTWKWSFNGSLNSPQMSMKWYPIDCDNQNLQKTGAPL